MKSIESRNHWLVFVTVLFLSILCGDSRADSGAVLEFMTYLGGSGYDQARDVAVDTKGNIYVVGGTRSRDFPATTNLVRPGHPESSSIHDYDVFVVKYDPAGKRVWSTLLGGPNYDRAYGVEVDAKGDVYIGGRAGAGFPVTKGAAQVTFMGGVEASHYGGQDGFVTKLSADGSRILWSTYFGADDFRIIRDIDIDATGNVYIGAGYRSAAASSGWRSWFDGGDRSLPPGWQSWFSGFLQDRAGGGHDAVVAKIRADGAQVLWATYLGGSEDDSFGSGSEPSIRTDSAGNVVVAMGAGPGLPTSTGAYSASYHGGPSDVYVAGIRADGRALLFGTYVGTGETDSPQGAHALALDDSDRAYVAGYTRSRVFPVTPSAVFGSAIGDGPEYAFAVQLGADGGELLASTFLPVTGEGIDVDADGNVYLTASVTSPGFPVTADAVRHTLTGGSDGAIIKLSPDLSGILYATLLGGDSDNRNDGFRGIAVTPDGTVAAAGTAATGWPLHRAGQDEFGGNGDVPVVKIRTRR